MSLYELNGPDIQYHTGIFTGGTNSGLIVAAVAALTAIAVGTLGVLHAHNIINIGPLNSLSTIWSFGIAGAGGVLLLAESIALFGLARKHLKIQKRLTVKAVKVDKSDLSVQLIGFCAALKKEVTFVEAPRGTNNLFILWQNDAGTGTVHMFPDKLMRDEYVADLEQDDYVIFTDRC